MKKILSLVIAFAMVAMMAMTAFANDAMYGPLDVIDFDEEVTMQRGEEYIKAGMSSDKMRSSEYLSINHYFQNGESWSNDLMLVDKLPIGTYGCALTSFTMILSHYGIKKNPGEVNKIVGSNACPLQYNGAANAFSLEVYASSGQISNKDSAVYYIRGSIDDDKPVLVSMKKGTNSHFVAAYGYIGTSILIQDPERSWNYTTLESYLDDDWTVSNLITYKTSK